MEKKDKYMNREQQGNPKATKDWKSHRKSFPKNWHSFYWIRLMSLFNCSTFHYQSIVRKAHRQICAHRHLRSLSLQNSTKQFNRKSESRDPLLMCIVPRSATFFFSSALSLHLSSFKLMIARAAALNTTRCSMFVFFVLFLHLFFLQHSSFVCHRDKNEQMTTEIECSTWMTLEFDLIYFMREIETFERLKRKKRKREREITTLYNLMGAMAKKIWVIFLFFI